MSDVTSGDRFQAILTQVSGSWVSNANGKYFAQVFIRN